jgi:DNA-binding transcriptional MerR regulator
VSKCKGISDNLDIEIMNQFSIKDIENLCGIKAHTIRIWEQRHNILFANREKSQHRIYSNDDLKKLLQISYLYHHGYKISKIAKLSDQQIHQIVDDESENKSSNEIYINKLIEAGLDFDKEKFEMILNKVVHRLGLENSLSQVIYPFLNKIGLFWLTNHIIPAQEHFVSHLIQNKIITGTESLTVNKNTNSIILVFAPEGEFHEISLLAANYILKKYHNNTIYFGINTALESLQYYLEHKKVTCIYTHVVTSLNNSRLEKYFSQLCEFFPHIKIVISGQAGKCIPKTPANLRILSSMDEMISFAKEEGTSI